MKRLLEYVKGVFSKRDGTPRSSAEAISKMRKLAKENLERKNRYLENIEQARNLEEVPKKTHVYAIAALEHYVVQARVQASESFILAKKVSMYGFVLLFLGALIGIFGFLEKGNVSDGVTYGGIIVAVGGALSQIVGATVFILYGKSMDQVNTIVKTVAEMQKYTFEKISVQIENQSDVSSDEDKLENK